MKLSITAKRMIVAIGIAALAIIAVAAAFYRSATIISFALGVFMTSGVNAVKLVMLEWAVNHAVNMGEDQNVGNFVRGQYFLRFVLTGLVLYAAVRISPATMWGAVAGLFTLQISAYSMKFFVGKDD